MGSKVQHSALRDASATCRGAYTTFLSGVFYVPGVRCLLRNRRRIGSVCPFVVVYDDRPVESAGHHLPAALLASLRRALRRPGDALVPLTSLFFRYPGGPAALRQSEPFMGIAICNATAGSAHHGHDGMRAGHSHRVAEGRRLYEMREYTMP